MEDKIEVGEYVRTKTGNITKIISVKDSVVWSDDFIDIHCRYNEGIIEKTDIIKHSKNIIDLIEAGDYVNGYKVIDKFIDPFIKEKKIRVDFINRNWQGDCSDETYNNENINSIVTKEQYKQIEYIVEE